MSSAPHASSPFATFAGRSYLNLETLKRNGDAVRTPVWFAGATESGAASGPNISPRTLYIYTLENTGKIKRIRNNPRVRIAPCDARGNLKANGSLPAPASSPARKPTAPTKSSPGNTSSNASSMPSPISAPPNAP